MKFRDIKQMTRMPSYRITVGWSYLETSLADWDNRSVPGFLGLDLDPEFQRAHVWDDERRIKFVEYCLKGGHSSREIYFNHPNWQGSYKGQMVLVDGKQRLEAVRKFMRNELPIFEGFFLKDFQDRLPHFEGSLYFNVNSLKTEKEVLQWYIDLNDGGVAHTKEEIDKVRKMLGKLEGK